MTYIQFLTPTNFKYLLHFSMTGKFECYFEEKLQNFTTEEPITAFFAFFHEKWLNSQENGLNRICNIIIERVNDVCDH